MSELIKDTFWGSSHNFEDCNLINNDTVFKKKIFNYVSWIISSSLSYNFGNLYVVQFSLDYVELTVLSICIFSKE